MNGKSIFKKENLIPVAVLFVICLVAALLMSVINMVTAPEIERQAEEAANAAMKVVLPDATTFTELTVTDEYPDAVIKAYKSDAGYVFQTKTTGNKAGIIAMCGVDNNGKIVGVEIISDEETPSYKAQIFPLVVGTEGVYAGKDAASIKPELVSGATKSSTGIYNAVKAALSAYAAATGGDEIAPDQEIEVPADVVTPVIDRTPEEMLELAKAMYSGDVTLEEQYVYQPDPTTVKVYKNAADETYVLYLATRTQYTPLETEATILVDNKGTVLAIELLTWTVGHGVEVTPEYLNSFVGKNKYSTDKVELVTGATVTANNLVIALESALRDVFGNIAMTDAEIEGFAKDTVPLNEELEKMELPESADATVRAMFRLKSGRGYVFYTVTSTQYVLYETEAFVYTDINGKVMDINLVTWTVGHGVEPTTDYLNSIIGKTVDTISDAELIAGATTTSKNLVDAVKAALTVVPEHVNYSLIAAVILAVAILGSVGTAVFFKIRRRTRA